MKKATKKELQKVPWGFAYDSKGFFWAVMYQANRRCRPRIVTLHPNHGDARREVFGANKKWESYGWGKKWSVKRFMFYLRGTEIDAYEHEWHRKEKIKS